MTQKVVGIIPARFASSRFPGKPLVPILGKTLIQRTFENAKLADRLDGLVVATDDERIYNHVVDFGGMAVMTPQECTTGTDRLAEVIKCHPHLKEAGVIVNIQGDEPCLSPAAINEAVDHLLNDPMASMSTLATPLMSREEADNPSIVKCILDRRSYALYFSRSLIPSNKNNEYRPNTVYLRHLGLYAYRPDFLLEYQSLSPSPLQLEEDLEQLKVLEYGFRIKVAVIKDAPIGVDTREDLKKVEQWLCKQNISL